MALAVPVGETLTFPAPEFFHRGAIVLDHDSVLFTPGRDHSGIALYGPRLPVAPGTYEFSVEFSSSPGKAEAGIWAVENPEGHEIASLPMPGGAKFSHTVKLSGGGPLLLVFVYAEHEPVEIKSIALRRIE